MNKLPDMDPETKAAILGALIGGGFGFLTSLITNHVIPTRQRNQLWRDLDIRFFHVKGELVSCRVSNGSAHAIRRAIVYVTVDHGDADIAAPIENRSGLRVRTLITQHEPAQLVDDRICWSLLSKSGIQFEIDIFAKESQAINVCRLIGDFVEIPSEHGFSSIPSHKAVSRVVLKRKRYTGTVKVVAENMDAKEFAFDLDPDRTDDEIRFKTIPRIDL